MYNYCIVDILAPLLLNSKLNVSSIKYISAVIVLGITEFKYINFLILAWLVSLPYGVEVFCK